MVAIILGMLKDLAPRVDKGAQRRDHGVQPSLLAEFLEQCPAVGYGIHHRAMTLLWQPDHEEQVKPLTATIQSAFDSALYVPAAPALTKGTPYLLIM